jgi:hypothetical protein
MSNLAKRVLRWTAPVTVVAAIGLAACGDGGEDLTRTAAPNPAVSDSDARPAACRWSSRFGVHFAVGAAEITRCQRSEDAVPARPSG